MVKKESIEFIESHQRISSLVTKFGGQPAWVGQPQWPLSKSTGRPMRFICQIEINSEMFKPVAAKMAYLFMTDGEEYVDGTWEADGGENAVVLQPGQTDFKTDPLIEGPSLYRMVEKPFHNRLVPESCEFSAALNPAGDPDFIEESERSEWDEATWESYSSTLDGNKIGGSPIFIQST